MPLKGLTKALKTSLGDYDGNCLFIVYVDEDPGYRIVSSLSYDNFSLSSDNNKIEVNTNVILENNTLSPITVSRIAIIKNITVPQLDNISNVTSSPHEVFPQQSVNVVIEPGEMINFKESSLQFANSQ